MGPPAYPGISRTTDSPWLRASWARKASFLSLVTSTPPAPLCACRLRVVLDDSEFVFAGKTQKSAHVARLAKEVDHHDRFGALGYLFFHRFWIETKSARLYIGKNGHGAVHQHRGRGCRHGVGRHDNLVARPHPERGDRAVERRGGGVVGNRVLNPELSGERPLKPPYYRPAKKPLANLADKARKRAFFQYGNHRGYLAAVYVVDRRGCYFFRFFIFFFLHSFLFFLVYPPLVRRF